MSSKFSLMSKKQLNFLLNQLSKEYRRFGGRRAKSQIILIGGASIIGAYNFRESTMDIDCFGDYLKEAINKVTDDNNLPNDWINKDFMFTDSYTPRLYEFAQYYKTFNHVLEVRVIKGAPLIAMKLRASRLYKNDFSDILGILKEEDDNGRKISIDEIKSIYTKLYGSYEKLSQMSRSFIETAIKNESYKENYYKKIAKLEKKNQKILKNSIKKTKANEIDPKNIKMKSIDEIVKQINKDKQ